MIGRGRRPLLCVALGSIAVATSLGCGALLGVEDISVVGDGGPRTSSDGAIAPGDDGGGSSEAGSADGGSTSFDAATLLEGFDGAVLRPGATFEAPGGRPVDIAIAGCTSVSFVVWGAGGGSASPGTGGAGGYAEAIFAPPSIERFSLTVATAGGAGTAGKGGFGGALGGGSGGAGTVGGAGGGGASTVKLVDGGVLLVAGGGGGACGDSSFGIGGNGGAGGGANAEPGSSVGGSAGSDRNGGGGATTSAPGVGASGATGGGAFVGGSGGAATADPQIGGGGGGGGWFGGGGGTGTPVDVSNGIGCGGGGGGSGFVSPLVTGTTISGTGATPANIAHPLYKKGVAMSDQAGAIFVQCK